MISRKHKQAQTIAEYAITVALIMFTVMTMTVFIKRLLQARIRDAHVYMLNEVRKVQSDVPNTYEPYYTISNADITRRASDRTEITDGPSGGIKTYYDQGSQSNTTIEQLPPKDAQ